MGVTNKEDSGQVVDHHRVTGERCRACRPLNVFTKSTVSSNVSSAGKDGSSPDYTSVCTLMHLHKLTHTHASHTQTDHQWGCRETQLELISYDVKSTILLPLEINKGL